MLIGGFGIYGSGGGSSPASVEFLSTEKNVATKPRKSGKFSITGTGMTTGKQVIILQATAPYTGKGTLADESEMDGLIVKGVVTSATNIDCYWNSDTYVKGNFKFNYLISA
jgi:hypothetical protein